MTPRPWRPGRYLTRPTGPASPARRRPWNSVWGWRPGAGAALCGCSWRWPELRPVTGPGPVSNSPPASPSWGSLPTVTGPWPWPQRPNPTWPLSTPICPPGVWPWSRRCGDARPPAWSWPSPVPPSVGTSARRSRWGWRSPGARAPMCTWDPGPPSWSSPTSWPTSPSGSTRRAVARCGASGPPMCPRRWPGGLSRSTAPSCAWSAASTMASAASATRAERK